MKCLNFDPMVIANQANYYACLETLPSLDYNDMCLKQDIPKNAVSYFISCLTRTYGFSKYFEEFHIDSA